MLSYLLLLVFQLQNNPGLLGRRREGGRWRGKEGGAREGVRRGDKSGYIM